MADPNGRFQFETLLSIPGQNDELEAARRASEAAQRKLFPKPTAKKRSVKAKRHEHQHA